MEYHVYWLLKSSCFEIFEDGKYDLFSSQKVNGNMIFITEKFLFWTFQRWEIRSFLDKNVVGKMVFIDYWKVLVLNFSEMGNAAFSRAKKLMERWYLLITEKFLFWTFRWWENGLFFQPKSWWKDDIYLVFLSFPWYFRTWEIWFFVQCTIGRSVW